MKVSVYVQSLWRPDAALSVLASADVVLSLLIAIVVLLQ